MARTSRERSFWEWQQSRQATKMGADFVDALSKSPASGGRQSPIPRAPGTSLIPSPNRGYGSGNSTSGNSQYTRERPDQPQPYIDDVDEGISWFSPFQPIWPQALGAIRPREWDYPSGYNLNYIQPRMELMSMLRGLRNSWGVLSTIIETRKDQLLRIPWTIQLRDKPSGKNPAVEEMRKFFRRPDGKLSYSQWSKKLLDDLFVIDAPTIYFSRDRRGRPLTAEVMDGATFFPLIDDAGRRPDSEIVLTEDGLTYLRRQPAFQQIIKNLPALDFDESEIMYVPMRLRPEMPIFGYAPTEQIMTECIEAIRKTIYQSNFWNEGTIPDMIISVPPEWTPRQIAMFQAHFDAMLSGNLRLKSKARFVPGGMKPFDIKNSSGESLWSQRDETLIRLACYAYSVSPTPFIKAVNRATANSSQQVAEQEGLYPLMNWWKDDIMDVIIQEKFGFEDVEFVFLPRAEPDNEKQSKIHQIQVKEGMRSINEVRDELGLEPIPGGDVALIQVGNAIIPLTDAAKGKAMPVQGGTGQAGDGTSDSKTPKPELPAQGRSQRGPAKPGGASPQPAAKSAYINDIDSASLDAKGHEATPSQQTAGNHRKGHFRFHGLNISLENPKGSNRKNGQLKAHYGYIRGTLGADGDQVDVFVGNKPQSDKVWVIDQAKRDGETFDEHKVMLGYAKPKRALRDYMRSYGTVQVERILGITELSLKEFKEWLKSGDTTSRLSKLDTISQSSNFLSHDQTSGPKRRKKKKKIPYRGPKWLQLNSTVQ